MLRSKSNIRYQIILNIIMTILSLIVLLPFVLLFMSSISSEASLLRYGYNFIPHEFSLSGYGNI